MFPTIEMREELPENLNQQENLSDQNQEGENQLPEFVSRLDYEALQSQNAQLQRRLEILAQNMMSPDYVQFLESKRMAEYGGYQQPNPQPQPEPEPDFDPDTASQRELVEYVTKKVANLIEQRVGEVDKQVKRQEYESQYEKAQREVQETMRKYPDFGNYRLEMIEIAKRHPNISAEEAYLLAKAKSGGMRTPTSRTSQKQPSTQQPRSTPQGGARPGNVSTSATKRKEDFSSYDDAIEEAMKKVGLI
jgi:hypothetical protein